ncbi:MAG: family 43 glycosylhydrolase [Pontiellaceae bacterium]|nr:family 43 glycosylhydrolase [Pontiellaceae bacterium]MBN2786574.1 family 43 glycosylhydrolase [Pontiellaceae bacterium]
MKTRLYATARLVVVLSALSHSVIALEGEPYIHDPSTIMECDGKYYTFGTRGGGLISEDGWTWHEGGVRPGGGAAPDALKIGDRYLVAYSATGGGLGGGHNGRILTMWNKTLDPDSPDFKYTDAIEVASSDGEEDCDAIDAGLFLDPTTGRLWCTYGTYFGLIRIVELDPQTGMRVEGNEAVDIAIDCEATTVIYRDGWYYLLGTHGTCCSGPRSTYNIRVGRSRNVTGPYVDHTGMEMIRGGGKLVIAANNRLIGPGHFGLIDLGDDVQKFSCHYEADLDDPGHFGVLGIRALLWKNGWPVAGDYFMGGTFEIESERSGYALEMGVEAVPLAEGRVRQMRVPGEQNAPRPRRNDNMSHEPIPDQDVAVVSKTWPAHTVVTRLGDYMLQAHQKWTIAPVENAGGYLGSPFFRITISGTDRALAATEDGEVVVEPAFSGDDAQLWRIDQLIDGTYRIMPKAESGNRHPMCLTAVGVSTPSLSTFDPDRFNSRWNLKKP